LFAAAGRSFFYVFDCRADDVRLREQSNHRVRKGQPNAFRDFSVARLSENCITIPPLGRVLVGDRSKPDADKQSVPNKSNRH